MNSKPWYKSKTVWFNAVTVIVAIATYFGFTPSQQLFQEVTAFLVSISPLVNFGLRLVTSKPITGTPSAPAQPSTQ